MKWFGWMGLGALTAIIVYAMRSAVAYNWEVTDTRQMGILAMFLTWCWILCYAGLKK